MLGTLDRQSSGEIYFNGQPLSELPQLDKFRAHTLGFVFQSFYLLPTLTALENVQIPMFESALNARQRVDRAAALLDEMGLRDRFSQYPGQLSAGERQRVAIARSLANEPDILLADEPTGNLDTENAARIMEILARTRESRGLTLIVVTHEPAVAQSAGRHIRIRDGRICSE